MGWIGIGSHLRKRNINTCYVVLLSGTGQACVGLVLYEIIGKKWTPLCGFVRQVVMMVRGVGWLCYTEAGLVSIIQIAYISHKGLLKINWSQIHSHFICLRNQQLSHWGVKKMDDLIFLPFYQKKGMLCSQVGLYTKARLLKINATHSCDPLCMIRGFTMLQIDLTNATLA